MSRRMWRGVAQVGLFSFSAGLVYLGLQGWRVNGLPAQYMGFIFAGFGVAGLFGFNIWAGGPLDPRREVSATGTRRPTRVAGGRPTADAHLRSYRCEICGFADRLEPSYPLEDAPCPNCGTLLFPADSKR